MPERVFRYGAVWALAHGTGGELKYCGLFKTPTLRNVATRGVFFHNGRFSYAEGAAAILREARHRF